jgi:hypothetical protein
MSAQAKPPNSLMPFPNPEFIREIRGLNAFAGASLRKSCPQPAPAGYERTKIRPAYAKQCAAGTTQKA